MTNPWYEVCVSQGGEIRDVIVEPALRNTERCIEQLAKRWPHCDMIFVRQHRLDAKRGPGASTFHILHKLTADFRGVAK